MPARTHQRVPPTHQARGSAWPTRHRAAGAAGLPDPLFRRHRQLFSHISFDGALAFYQATLVPWFWFLTRTSDCCIFQGRTAPDIVEDIFREHGYTDFQEFLVEPHHCRNYCVQYRKTDFDFTSWLLEQEGIYYFFRHENNRHTLVLADDYDAYHAIADHRDRTAGAGSYLRLVRSQSGSIGGLRPD